jgi:hypothetical protein
MKFAARIYLPIGLALLLTTVAHANTNTVTFGFSGNVTSVDPLLSNVTKPGDPITGVYTFDPNVPDTDPSDPTVGVYTSPTPYSVSVGTFTAQGTPVLFNIFDNLNVGQQLLRTQYRAALSQVNLVVNGLTYNGFSLDLVALSTTPLSIFSSDALPATPPSTVHLGGTSVLQLRRCQFALPVAAPARSGAAARCFFRSPIRRESQKHCFV